MGGALWDLGFWSSRPAGGALWGLGFWSSRRVVGALCEARGGPRAMGEGCGEAGNDSRG